MLQSLTTRTGYATIQQEREPTPAETRLAKAQEQVAHQMALIEYLLMTGRDIRLALRLLRTMQQALDRLRLPGNTCAWRQAGREAAAAEQVGALVARASR
jgi:hypothetical protein